MYKIIGFLTLLTIALALPSDIPVLGGDIDSLPPIHGPVFDIDKDLSTCPCVRSYIPVCGSNGLLYDNKCLLNCKTELMKKRNKEPVTMVEAEMVVSVCNLLAGRDRV